MNYEFEYAGTITYTGNFKVEHIDSVALKMSNGNNKEWYISVDTELGETKIFFLGPIMQVELDTILILPGFVFNYQHFIYNEKKIISTIEKHLNNGEIIEVEEIDKEDFQLIKERWIDAEYC